MNNSGADTHGVTYRAATSEDADEISKLVLGLMEKFTFHEYTDEGRELMKRQLAPDVIRETHAAGNVIFVAVVNERIIGVASIRNITHLTLNFVDENFHRRGISRALWALGKAECIKRGNPGRFTLRASTYAIPVYEKWGFVRTGEVDQSGGVLSHPMVLEG